VEEMKLLKLVDKAMESMVSEFPGRNESERPDSLVKIKYQWPSLYLRGEGNN